MTGRSGSRWARWSAALGLLACVALAPRGASAQTTGTVEGRIRDDQGVAVYTATVVLTDADSLRRSAETDRLGFFRVGGLGPGSYRVDASRLGHAPATTEVTVQAGGRVELDLVLARAAVQVAGVAVEAERSRARVRFEEVAGRTVHELGIEDLRRIPGVAEADLLRAIEVLPGVVSTSDFSSAFHVRGGSADQNLILLDGVPIISPFHLGGFFSVFNADMMARAELSSGGFPARFGGRVSSLIEIESDPGDGDFRVDGGVSVLAARLAVGDGFTGSPIGLVNARWRVSARRSYFDQIMRPVFHFPYHLTDLQGVFEGWTGGGDRIRVSAYSGADVLDLTQLDPEDFPLRIQWDWGNDVVGASWSHPLRRGGSLDVTGGFTQYGTELVFPEFGDTRFKSRIRQGLLKADLSMLPDERRRLGFGVSADRLKYDNLFQSGGTVFGDGLGTGWQLGGYAQAEWTVPQAWVLETGLRLDAWAPDPGDPLVEVAPRVAVKRFLGGGAVALKGAVGRYTQFVHSLRDEELPLGLDIWVLSGAHAPRVISDQIQGGVETFLGEQWQLSAEGYWRRFDGVLTFNAAEDPNDDFDDMLRGRGTSWGWDVMARRDGPGLSGWLALSWLKAQRTFPDILAPLEPRPDVTYAPVFDRRVDLDLVLRFPVGGGWLGGLRWNFGSGTPYTRALGSYAYYTPRMTQNGRLFWQGADDNTDTFGGYAVWLGERNGTRYPAYHRLDLSVRKRYEKSWGHITPYLDVLNLYNRKNVLFYFYEFERNPPTRSGISMFPLLPTIGVEAGFR
jgi:hypothetical protein